MLTVANGCDPATLLEDSSSFSAQGRRHNSQVRIVLGMWFVNIGGVSNVDTSTTLESLLPVLNLTKDQGSFFYIHLDNILW